MKRLIVNADDFGLTSGINRAVAELNRKGCLTSCTLMAAAPASDEAVLLARQLPGLGVGCHVVLVDGKPVLPADQIPTLVDRDTGLFRRKLGAFVRDLFRRRIKPTEIQAEAEAQIAQIRSWGLMPTHVDTHKHTHLFPQVLSPVLAAAKTQGIPAIRNPFEPQWSRAATAHAPLLRRAQVAVFQCFRANFLRQCAAFGIATTQGALGLVATGTLDSYTLDSLLNSLPDGSWEIVTHPGYNDLDLAHAGTRLLASRETERAALLNACFPPEIKLMQFRDLALSQDSTT